MPQRRPIVVELAGVAGAGKSTLALALAQLDPTIRARPRVREQSYLANVPSLVPTFLGLHWPFRGVLRKEMKRMLRVRTLYRMAQESTLDGTLLFDEGPVYMLARILMFGADNTRSATFEQWWRRTIAEWAETLDVVVWLDAPDDVLATRLHTRAQPHPLQGAPDRAVTAFFRSYRDAFTRVLDELLSGGRPRLWTISTAAATPSSAARALLDRLHGLATPPRSVAEPA